MWLIKDSRGTIKYLMPGKTLKFGRKQADIVLANDTSISRFHATVSVIVKDQIKISERSSICIIKDTNSKYGTFVIRNGIQLKVSIDGLELQPLDVLKFGLQQHIFTVENMKFLTVTSRLNSNDKVKLKEIMDCIGGIVTDIYNDDCTHLTMSSATSTNKLIFALISGKPIVNINYWVSLLNAIKSDRNLPDPNSFTLLLQDKGIQSERISLTPNPIRKTLFKKKSFIFFTENTYNDHKKMIVDAGGIASLHQIDENNDQEFFFSGNNIIMQINNVDNVSSDIKTFYAKLNKKMKEKNIRMIAETEIPLAIVHVSLEQYCNPKYHFKSLMKRKGLKKDTSEILALDTQDVLGSEDNNIKNLNSKQIFIPDTDESIQNDVQGLRGDSFIENNQILSAKQSSVINIKEDNTAHFVQQEKNFIRPISSNNQRNEVEKMKNENLLNDTSVEKLKDVMSHEKNITLKRKLLDLNDGNDNFNNNWKSTNEDNSCKSHKRKRNLLENNGTLNSLEQHKIIFKEKKENKLDKWGFKKSNKKNIDFDLDDLDVEDVNNEEQKKVAKLAVKKNTNSFNEIELVEEFPASLQIEEDFQESYLNNENFTKKTNQNWTLTVSLEETNSRNSVKPNMNGYLFRSNVTKESIEYIKDVKLFKKVSNQVPIKRIGLLDMNIGNSDL